MNRSRTLLLAVGVGAYSALPALRCARADAEDLAGILGAMPVAVHPLTLLDAAATRAEILVGLAWLAAAGPNDTAVITFSGHGMYTGSAAYLCPIDAVPARIAETAIESAELTAALRRIRAARLLVLLDACHSGAIGDPRATGALRGGFPLKRMAGLVAGNGRVVLAASAPGQSAWELAGMRNGLFTHYVLEGLRGAAARSDRTVWVSDLFGYVSRQVQSHGLQTPYQNAIGGDFVVGLAPKATVQARAEVAGPAAHQLRRLVQQHYDRSELALLCHDLGLRLEDLWGTTHATQVLALLDHCARHGRYAELVAQIAAERPKLLGSLGQARA